MNQLLNILLFLGAYRLLTYSPKKSKARNVNPSRKFLKKVI
jgi:hypothetical protein